MVYFARSEGASGQKQLLRAHLQNVAELTGRFAEETGLPRQLGEWAGWLHDLGKYSDEFQSHLARQDRDFVEHAAHGALVAVRAGAVECAFAVNAHHSGLGTRSTLKDLTSRNETTAGLFPPQKVAERATALLERARTDGSATGSPSGSVLSKGSELQFELRTRMLLSCLADADRLDAEAWMSQWQPHLRTTVEALDAGARLERVLAYIANLADGVTPSTVTRARDDVLRASLAAAELAPGFFSLTVPTGGGKTLASLAFALAHAKKHGMRRVIFVVPFLTVIEQNAEVIRAAVGEAEHGSAVLEHHSNVVADIDGRSDGQAAQEVRQRLLAENWDAPVIITTAVQFFESLFSDHPTQVRKIHNIANSVVVFDEAQTFPPELLRPLVGMLRQLADEYCCSAVVCTATQPALSDDIRGSDVPEPLLPAGTVREIVPEPDALFGRLKRVNVLWPGPESTPLSAVAASMIGAKQALAVVNTKRQARALFGELLTRDAGALHLSTRMCAAHRGRVVAEIRRRLSAGERCLVASTQLIEAGVDVDFPTVWRAFGPLDAVAQVAGRCNREGRLPSPGTVTVLRAEDDRMPGGVYRAATRVTELMLTARRGAINIHVPACFTEYFVGLYNTSDLDKHKIGNLRRALDFPEVARCFKLIDDITTGVLVPYGEGAKWLRRLLSGEQFGRGQLRQMQPFMVSLYEPELKRALASGSVTVEGDPGIHVLHGDYGEALGLVLAGDDPLID
jgi:CRISPR-associated endonuclease/helicase Cas3